MLYRFSLFFNFLNYFSGCYTKLKMKQSKSVKVRLMQNKNQSILTININYKLVIEKILKLVIRQVLMIYMVYSAQK